MERPLILTSYGDKLGETYSVSLNPYGISMTFTAQTMVEKQGISLYRVIIRFVEEGTAELYVNGEDLKLLESTVGFIASLD